MNASLATAVEFALERAAAKGCLVRPSVPATVLEDAARQLGRPIPSELVALYRRANGAELGTADILDVVDLVEFNQPRGRFEEMPGAVIIGTDGGDGVFLLDPDLTFGHDADAIYLADLNVMAADLCRIAETDFARFVEAAMDGVSFREAPTLAEQSMNDLFATAEAFPERVQLRLPLPVLERIRPEYGLATHAPLLGEFYDRCNGLTIPEADFVIGGIEEVSAVPSALDETGRPGCLHIGHAASFEAYVSTGGWRGLPSDRLLLAPDDASLSGAAPLGRFPDVVRTFILSGGTA